MKSAQAAYWFILAFFMCIQCAYLENYNENDIRNDGLEARPCQCKNGACEFDRYRGYICTCPQEFGLYTETQCKKCDCGRAANCSFGPGNFRNMKHCLCPEGYKDLDGAGFCKGDCSYQPCKNGGTCKVVGEEIACECAPPFYGDRCTENPCSPNSCLNSGKCVIIAELAACECIDGYTGDRCEIALDPCRSNPCLNEGACSIDEGVAKCHCPHGFTGDTCETEPDPCSPNPCKNNGVCTNEEGEAKCTCEKPYIGGKCEIALDPCRSNPCLNEGACSIDEGVAKCHCLHGFTGDTCETVSCNSTADCPRFRKCTELSSGEKLCRCLPGKTGEQCERDVEECVTGKYKSCKGKDGRCIYNDDKQIAECHCAPGNVWFEGRYSQYCRTICDNNCANYGQCKDTDVGKFCECKRGTSGQLCETVDECERRYCGTNITDVTCVYDLNRDGGKCVCADSTKLFYFNKGRCQVPCTGGSAPHRNCQHGGDCGGYRGGSFCKCENGTSGDLCEIVDDCIENFCGKKADVKCVYDAAKKAGTCKCDDPSKLFDSNAKKCRGWCISNDECESFEKCTELPSGYMSCRCLPGINGEQCENIKDCNSGKYKSCRDDNGRCVYNMEKQTAECDCGIGKMWDDKTNRCRRNCDGDCANNGVCEGDGDVKFCKCAPGTEGDLCEMVKGCSKEENLCGLGEDVKCVYDERKHEGKCLCDNSTKLFDFDRKECRVPCKDDCANEGECLGVGEDKFCKCKPGTTGDLCTKTDDCTKPDFCGTKEDAKCVHDERAETSFCKCDHSTKRFDPMTKECRVPCKNACDNNGKCEGEGEDKFCRCKPGTSGNLCTIVDHCFGQDVCGTKKDVQCVYDNRKEVAICKCDDSRKSFDPKTKECRVPCHYKCLNNGYCDDSGDAKFCRCKEGTSGDSCATVDDCAAGLCGEKVGVKCVYDESQKGGSCECFDTTKSFDERTNECRTPCSDNCKNNGLCINFVQHNFCVCKPGTSGDLCATVDDCAKDDFCGRRPGLICVYNGINGAICKCQDSTKQFDNIQNECRIPCQDDCDNNGKCAGEGEAKFCRCKAGTSGNLCTIVDHCVSQDVCGTKTDAKCVYDESKEAGFCKCDDPRKRFDPKAKECRVSCKDDCDNNGKCEGESEAKFCKCKPGTSGDLCTVVDDCAGQDVCGTKTDVQCLYDESKEVGVCKCDDPRKRFDPKAKECREESICADYTCHNGGVCIENAGGTPRCYCKAPFSGERCEKDPCSTNPCKNEGICEVKGGAYNCICKEQFWGETCEMDPCTPNPCQNSGTCKVNGMMFRCTCKELFTGSTCDIDISDNRFISSAVLFLIVLILFVLMCYGCCFFRINQNFRPVCESSETCSHSCERKKKECV